MTRMPQINLPATLPPDHVLRVVAVFRGVAATDILSPSKVAAVARARHEAGYFMRDICHLTYARIGEVLGGRDPSTIMAGCDSVMVRMHKDASYAGEIDLLGQKIRETPAHGDLPDRQPALAVARRVLHTSCPSTEDVQQMAMLILSLRSILANQDVTDSEARRAGLYMMGGQDA